MAIAAVPRLAPPIARLRDVEADPARQDDAVSSRDTDGLTGVLTRRAIAAALDGTAWRRDARIAVLTVDIDALKQLNDRYGHALGDQLLVEVARRLQEPLGEDDLIGRIGGDEFVIVCRRVSEEEQLADLAEALRRAVARRPVRLQNNEFEVTVTVGGTLVESAVTTTEALNRADQQLYLAKRRAGSDAHDRVSELVVGLLEAHGRTIETRLASAVAEVALASLPPPAISAHSPYPHQTARAGERLRSPGSRPRAARHPGALAFRANDGRHLIAMGQGTPTRALPRRTPDLVCA